MAHRPPRVSRRRSAVRTLDVHAHGEMEATVQGSRHHRDVHAPHRAHASGRNAALATRLSYDPDGLDQFGSEGQRHGHGDTGLVEHRRERAEEPVRAGQRVGRAKTEQDHGDLQSLHEGVEDRLHGDGPADAHGHRPGGERHLREGETTPGDPLSEQDLDHHPVTPTNTPTRKNEERAQGTAPAKTPPQATTPSGLNRMGCSSASLASRRPQPPGHRVQGAATGRAHATSAGLRRHRRATTSAADQGSPGGHCSRGLHLN